MKQSPHSRGGLAPPFETPDRPHRLLSLSAVCDLTGRSRWWIRAAVVAGRFPQPVRSGGRSIFFVEHEIEAWVLTLIAERDHAAGNTPQFRGNRP